MVLEVKARNGETVLVSQFYKTKLSAKRSALKLALANDMEMRVGYPITRPGRTGLPDDRKDLPNLLEADPAGQAEGEDCLFSVSSDRPRRRTCLESPG